MNENNKYLNKITYHPSSVLSAWSSRWDKCEESGFTLAIASTPQRNLRKKQRKVMTIIATSSATRQGSLQRPLKERRSTKTSRPPYPPTATSTRKYDEHVSVSWNRRRWSRLFFCTQKETRM